MLQIYSEDDFLPFLGTAIQKLSIGSLWGVSEPHNYEGEAATAQHFLKPRYSRIDSLATAALSTLSDLRSLVIAFILHDYPWLENVLGQIRSAHFAELVLDFSNHDALEDCAHKGLDDLLSRKHLESICRLKYIPHHTIVDVKRRLRMAEKLLPRSCNAGPSR